LPESPEEEHRRRVLQYSLAMGIRVLCVIACIWVRGWWLLIPAAGAVFLPYVAVVLANVGSRRRSSVIRPDHAYPALEEARGAVLELPVAPHSPDQEPRP